MSCADCKHWEEERQDKQRKELDLDLREGKCPKLHAALLIVAYDDDPHVLSPGDFSCKFEEAKSDSPSA